MNSQMVYSLAENNNVTLTTLPVGRNAVGSRWVYTIKEDSDVLRPTKLDMLLRVINRKA